MLVKAFPTLYKKNSRDSVQVWDISVLEQEDRYFIATQYGQLNGKSQVARDEIISGKNLGRSNETSVKTQAISEAKSKWMHKQDREGYVMKLESVDQDLRHGIDPMLAHRYDKYPDKIEFPCFIQPKLDGHRCIAIVNSEECTLFSRTRNVILGVPHINAALIKMMQGMDGILILDGELYNHDYHSKFETLTSFIRSEIPKVGHEIVQYHLYDIVVDSPFYERKLMLDSIRHQIGSDGVIRFVDTLHIDQTDVVPCFKLFRQQGYEGAILRNREGQYIHKRSYDLLKVKEFEDTEFRIVSVNEGRGKLKGHAIFECVLEDGITRFEAKMRGSTDKLREIFENPEPYLGRLLTVQFQGRTKNNIPRFPVGVRVREEV